MAEPQFRWSIERDGPKATIRLSGEFDLGSHEACSQLFQTMQSDGVGELQLDLREVTFLDSTALGVILGAAQRAREMGTSLTLIPGPDRVHRVFEIAGVTELFQFVSGTENDAAEAPEDGAT